ncbi:MAG: hypothetical protein OJF48_001920 [Afipia sp.]|nr:MAG: hypothetical protein OJF48_001920 [Afipia sp.]
MPKYRLRKWKNKPVNYGQDEASNRAANSTIFNLKSRHCENPIRC